MLLVPKRTTITLSDANYTALKRRAHDDGSSFKEVVNRAIEAGLSEPTRPRKYRIKPMDLGEALLPIEHTMRLVGELEDAELIRKMDLGK